MILHLIYIIQQGRRAPALVEYEVGGDRFVLRGCFGAEREPSVPELPGARGHSEKMKTSAPL